MRNIKVISGIVLLILFILFYSIFSTKDPFTNSSTSIEDLIGATCFITYVTTTSSYERIYGVIKFIDEQWIVLIPKVEGTGRLLSQECWIPKDKVIDIVKENLL